MNKLMLAFAGLMAIASVSAVGYGILPAYPSPSAPPLSYIATPVQVPAPPAYIPAPAPYAPAPYVPAPAPYAPAPYVPAPAPYVPAPAPYAPAPYVPAPAPYAPAPYAPAPAIAYVENPIQIPAPSPSYAPGPYGPSPSSAYNTPYAPSPATPGLIYQAISLPPLSSYGGTPSVLVPAPSNPVASASAATQSSSLNPGNYDQLIIPGYSILSVETGSEASYAPIPAPYAPNSPY